MVLVIWIVEFSKKGYKIRRFLAKNQHIQRKLSNFENWSSGELSKIGDHFSNKVIIKKCASKLVFFNEKKMRKIQMVFDVEN